MPSLTLTKFACSVATRQLLRESASSSLMRGDTRPVVPCRGPGTARIRTLSRRRSRVPGSTTCWLVRHTTMGAAAFVRSAGSVPLLLTACGLQITWGSLLSCCEMHHNAPECGLLVFTVSEGIFYYCAVGSSRVRSEHEDAEQRR